MIDPLLTVVIPTIDRPTLARAVDSVMRQTVPTYWIVERDPNRTGCGPTINRALRRVTTPWLATLGDDDTLHAMFTELLATQDQAADMVIFQMQYEDGSRLPLATDPADLNLGLVGCSYAVKTDVARSIGYIEQPCTPLLAEDWEMIRTIRDQGGDIRIVHRVAYYVRHDPHADESGGEGSESLAHQALTRHASDFPPRVA